MKKVRMGMVGGGAGAFIGAIHRAAAAMDGQIELVCGALSSDPERARLSALELGIEPGRCYTSYQEMFAAEAALPEEQRMQFVSIVTPNHMHFPVAKQALEAGFHVLSDKPATLDLREALELKTLVDKSNCLYGLTHTYTGYPLIKEARHLIGSGQLGTVTKVVVEYSQGWLASKSDEGSKQAEWRLDPARAGSSCCMGDIGVHAANLAEYTCDDEISDICADLVATVPGRQLDDDGTVLLRFKSGARGVLMASQVSVGEENRLVLRVYGDKASLEWSQMEPNTLWLKFPDKPTQMIRAGVGTLAPETLANMRTPAGHPEGYLEAFANIYRSFAEQIRAVKDSGTVEAAGDIPSIHQAVRGMAFIENVVTASQSNQKWHAFSLQPHS